MPRWLFMTLTWLAFTAVMLGAPNALIAEFPDQTPSRIEAARQVPATALIFVASNWN